MSLWMLSWTVSFFYFISFIYKTSVPKNQTLAIWDMCETYNFVFSILHLDLYIFHSSRQENNTNTWLNVPLGSSSSSYSH
jgi:hypothetical protein